MITCLKLDGHVINGYGGDLVNSAGDVAGGAFDAAGLPVGGFQEIGTNAVIPLAPVESLAGTSGAAQAYGVNSSRLVVGFSDSSKGEVPVSWSGPGWAPQPLPLLSTPREPGWAFGVNDAGQIVGSEDAYLCSADRKTCTGGLFAVLWSGGTVRNLGTLAGPPCADGSAPHCGDSEARAINSSSEVVGASIVGNTSHAFSWQNGVMQDLGTLDTRTGDQVGAIALALNDAGVVVGASSFATRSRCSSDSAAFIYRDGAMHNLEDFLPAADKGWQFVAATGISNTGDVVGWGFPPDSCGETAFLLREKSPWMVITPSSLDATQGRSRDQAALDFANQNVEHQSSAQKLTITNNGDLDLRVGEIKVIRGAGVFEVSNAGDCTGRAVAPNDSCMVDVSFTPTRMGPVNGELAVYSDAPATNPEYVSLTGIGTRLLMPPATVDESAATHFDTHCWSSLKFAGWKLLQAAPQQMIGEVVQAHMASEDIHLVPPLRFHNNADSNFFVYPDWPSQHLLAIPGNFHTADRYELGRTEVEWERRSAAWPGGFPEWAWPTQGDRVRLIGYHVFDCGHDDQGYRAEIHPPRLVVTYRNAALSRLSITPPLSTISGRTGSFAEDQTAATRVDVFASSYGGAAINSERGVNVPGAGGWFQPVNDRNYEFVVMAPPKPSPDAVLNFKDDVRERIGVGGLALEHKKLANGRGYLVTLPFSRVRPLTAESLMVFGATIQVGWTGANVPKLELRHYIVTLESLHVVKALTGEWSLYGSVNDDSAGSLMNLGGLTQSNNERYQVVRNGETIRDFAHPSFEVALVPGQLLHVAFRVSAWTKSALVLSAGASDFMGTAEGIWLDPPSMTARLESTADLAIGHEDDVDKACKTPCFTVTVKIDRLS
ncbi:MAG: choice-of-anchor D domain-containing protein [Gaiellaceae bacterium]